MLETSFMPTKIIFGCGAVSLAAEESAKLGKHAMLVIDPFFVNAPLGQDMIAHLKAVMQSVTVFSNIQSNPLNTSIDEAVQLARKSNCDVFVAVGGGSSIDSAKAVSITAKYGGACWDYTERAGEEVKRPNQPAYPVIAIPTTSGTGSETTRFSVINNPSLKSKCTVMNDAVYPKLALVDPELTVSLPRKMTAFTGLDVFAHAFESYLCVDATRFSRMYAMEAIELFAKSFDKCLDDGKDIEARSDMAWASTLAGVTISHAGTTLPHGMGQTLSGLTDAPHGASVACCLPQITEWTLPMGQKDFAVVARVLNCKLEKADDRTAAYALPDMIYGILEKAECPAHFSAFGFKDDMTEAFVSQMLTARVGAIKHHIRQATEQDLRKLIEICK